MATREEVVKVPEQPDIQQSLFYGTPVEFRFKSGLTVLLHITVLKVNGDDYLAIAEAYRPENAVRTAGDIYRMFFLKFNLLTGTGVCVWYTDAEAEELDFDIYHTPDYWARAMQEEPRFH